MSDTVFPLDGGCDCRTVRYRMLTRPASAHATERWIGKDALEALARPALARRLAARKAGAGTRGKE